jgi:hypothetical protein
MSDPVRCFSLGRSRVKIGARPAGDTVFTGSLRACEDGCTRPVPWIEHKPIDVEPPTWYLNVIAVTTSSSIRTAQKKRLSGTVSLRAVSRALVGSETGQAEGASSEESGKWAQGSRSES